jgi:hypothetical protein
MRVTMMLADAAHVADGKLYILGGGWSLTGPDPTPSAVVVKLEIDRHETGISHHWELFLEDADGQLIILDTPEGPQTVEVRGEFEAGEPVGIPEGAPIDLPIAINFGPLPLMPGARFTWRLVIDGNTPNGGALSFSTRSATPESL